MILKRLMLSLSFLTLLNLNAQNFNTSISGNTNASVEEGEAHIAIDPLDSNNMVMGFMELTANGVQFKIYNSDDGGYNWQVSGFDPASGAQGDYPTYSVIGGGDIVFAYDKQGTLYCSWINLLADMNLASPLDTCIWTAYWAKSTDNGSTFTLETGNDHFFGLGKIGLSGGFTTHDYEDGIVDRQWMAVDLSSGPYENNLYVGYINYPFILSNTGLKVKTKAPGQTTFSGAVTAYSGSGQLTNIGVDNNGVLHYCFADIQSNEILHVFSDDGGQTFSTTHGIYGGSNLFPNNNHKVNGRENAAPSLAIDGTNKLHLVWSDFPPGEDQPVSYYSTSDDGGLNWSQEIDLENYFDGGVFMPVVSASNNHVSISCNVLDSTGKSEYYHISSYDNGAIFSQPVKVSSGITDFDAIGTSVFVGDYSSAVRTDCAIFGLWTDCGANGCKQYISRYDECASLGLTELTPVESSFTLNNLYPNPAENDLSFIVKSELNDMLTIEVYNAIGQQQLVERFNASEGENQYELNVSGLSKGHYILKVQNTEGTFITRTFIKK